MYLILAKVHLRLCDTLLDDRLDEQFRTDEVLVVNSKAVLVFRDDNIVGAIFTTSVIAGNRCVPHSPKHRNPRNACFSRERIPDRQHGVSQLQEGLHHTLVRFGEEIRFTSFGVDMGVCSEEGSKDSDLIPTD
jgi:hypothetical protein